MAVKKRKNKKIKKDVLDYMVLPKIEIRSETKKGIVVVMIVALGILSFMGLFGYGGKVGMYLDKSLILAFGFGKWIFPFILMFWAIFLFQKNKGYFRGSHYLGLFLFILSIQSLFHLYYPRPRWEEIIYSGKGGGYIGMFFAKGFYSVLGSAGSWVILLAFLIISLLLMFNTTLDNLFGKKSFVLKFFLPIRYLFIFIKGLFERDYEDEEEEEIVSINQDEDEEINIIKPVFSEKEIEEAEEDKGKVEVEVNIDNDEEAINWEINNIKIDLPLNLLNKKTGKPNSGDMKHNEMVIQRTLENFGIPVEMGDVEVGPSVTQYTLKPSAGIKLSRITNLSNDLALSLAAHPIRIEAPIPGKSLVGIEVPNKVKAVVTLRQVLASKEFKTRKNNLMMALGEDVAGHSWTYDITKMPHLLIAGATNSGKSVCINSIIVSLLYQNNPNDLRFIMVDPKRVELPVYNGIPHLLTPVITDVKKTVNALKWCLNEMDRRFEV
ncbi:DNA translocase FtsK 4TM domain-containing protein, partial [bacterium]|nr:DNA translocase FtsK 4TM domain-containing protein [bacterium]